MAEEKTTGENQPLVSRQTFIEGATGAGKAESNKHIEFLLREGRKVIEVGDELVLREAQP